MNEEEVNSYFKAVRHMCEWEDLPDYACYLIVAAIEYEDKDRD